MCNTSSSMPGMPMATIQHLHTRLRAYTKLTAIRTDAFLVHLNKVLSSSAGVEAVLCTLCYTLVFVHSRLNRILARRYERLALTLASKASQSMFPGETVVATIEPPPSRLSETTASVKALSDLVDDFRFFTRLWGLVTIYNFARDNYAKPPGDAILKTLVWGQVGAQAIFQYLENGAYLTSKGILRSEGCIARERSWWVWSNRFWLLHTVLEGLRLLRVRQLKYNEEFGAKEEGNGELKMESRELEKRWHRDFYANAGWFPLTLHWSHWTEEDSPVTETWVGLFGMIPGLICLMNAWEETG